MKNSKTFGIGLIGLLAGIGSVFADQMTLKASDDSWVNGNTPAIGINYGSDTSAALRYQNTSWGKNVSLYKFDLSALPANIIVTSVRMRFYTALAAWPGPTNFAPVAIFQNTQDWSETNVTFATAPTYDAAPVETLDHFNIVANPTYFTGANTITAGGWLEFEGAGTVALVQGWAAGTIANDGVSVWGTGDFLNDGRLFRLQTKENPATSVQPGLIVTYTIIPEPATLGLIGVAAAGVLLLRRFVSM
ncbi:MAG: DNRLRE domain-containing protein [Kiritimatiellales bacterium]|nr:DNRLRE domain-containing protein [Kiritimatiellales bacterium]